MNASSTSPSSSSRQPRAWGHMDKGERRPIRTLPKEATATVTNVLPKNPNTTTNESDTATQPTSSPLAPVMTSSTTENILTETRGNEQNHTTNPLSLFPNHGIVELRVGDRQFTTAVSTLTSGSKYFFALRENKFPTTTLPPGDCSSTDAPVFFIDHDGDSFAHILAFLRTGVAKKFDLSSAKEVHEHKLLLSASEFFGVDMLTRKLTAHFESHEREKREMEEREARSATSAALAANVSPEPWECVEVEDLDGKNSYAGALVGGVYKTTKSVYVCPRDIDVHTTPERCGRLCLAAGEGKFEKKEVVMVLVQPKSPPSYRRRR